MKKLFMATIMAAMVTACSIAGEKKTLKEVDVEALAKDTQVMLKDSGESHSAFAWWIPREFWASALFRDTTLQKYDKDKVLDMVSGISLLAVVEVDISASGGFTFYSKEEIDKNMTLFYIDADGSKQKLSPMQSIDPDLQYILDAFKPILGSFIGKFGENMHFYVLNDKADSSHRVLDPHQKGQIDIQIARAGRPVMKGSIEMPLDALFIPRKCANGKDAHISWEYCPWSGEKLE